MDLQFWNPGKVWIGKTRLWLVLEPRVKRKKERKKERKNQSCSSKIPNPKPLNKRVRSPKAI